MLQETSVESFVANERSQLNKRNEQTILQIFRAAGEIGLTTNEMLAIFHEWTNKTPETTPHAQVFNASVNNNLKGRRTDLTHKGLIREAGKRQCKVTARTVLYFVYVGEELPKDVQLKNELKRVQIEVHRLTVKKLDLLNALGIPFIEEESRV